MLNKALSYIFSVEFLTEFPTGTEIINISKSELEIRLLLKLWPEPEPNRISADH